MTARITGQVSLPDSWEAINDYFLEQGWSDGLPIVPPTEERVAAMLAYTDRDPDEQLGLMPPLWGRATVAKVAVNAVVAGCRPEYFPVVLAATEAVLDPAFNLYGVQATTNPTGPMVVINGPIARELNVNCGNNLFGPRNQANATIGRALRLVLLNVGGGVPGMGDMSTLGSPSKFTACWAENEAESPWTPFHAEKGFAAGTSTVTVLSSVAPVNVIEMSTSAEEIVTTMIGAMTAAGSNCLYFDEHPGVVLCPVMAQSLQAAGYDKVRIRKEVYDRARVDLDRLGPIAREAIATWKGAAITMEGGRRYARVLENPEALMVFVAGGGGDHMAILPCFNGSRPVTRSITLKSGAPVASVREFAHSGRR